MSSIYKSATTLISAAAVSAVWEGFLRTDKELDWFDEDVEYQTFRFCDFSVTLPNGSTGNLTIASELRFLPQHPLDQRAWAYQEHFLSSRKLIFSSVELLVECNEQQPRPLRDSFLSYKNHNYLSNLVSPISTWDWQDVECNLRWSDIIYQYSGRLLTQPDDRGHAFQGISNEMEAFSGKETHYGMTAFSSSIIAWDARVPSPARSNRAPSWSWISLDTIVGSCVGMLSTTLDAQIRFHDANDYQRLSVTACLIDGAAWGGMHCIESAGSSSGVCRADLEAGLPDPCERTYLLVLKDSSMEETVLILSSAGSGVYRRTGIYWGTMFANGWSEAREVTLI